MESSREIVSSQQQEFIEAIFSDDVASKLSYSKGLEIYRNNLLATAVQALSITFPTLSEQIGQDLMNYVGCLLLMNSPPNQGDWAEWGESLPELLTSLPALEEYPFVAEVARLDWAIHQAERAIDSSLDNGSLHLLSCHDLDDVGVQLNRAVKILSCEYPVIELRNISDSPGEKAELQSRIDNDQLKQKVLVYRIGFKGEAIEIEDSVFTLLNLLKKGISIGHALDQIEDRNFDFAAWLPMAIQNNLITKLVAVR